VSGVTEPARPPAGHEEGPIAHALEAAQSTSSQGELVRRMVVDLATEIIEGNLPAGHLLTSVELGQRFGTSRTPVREALRVLQQEGLVEIAPRRRPAVASLSLPELRDVYEIRASLYALIAAAIVDRATDEDIGRLGAPLAQMQEAARAGDLLAYFYGTVRFRRVEADICPNQRVGGLIDSLGLRTYRLRRFGLSLPGRMEVSARDYTRLVEAYRERDRDLAIAVTRSLMTKALAAIEASWGELEGGGRRASGALGDPAPR